jgi:hypothetical protein
MPAEAPYNILITIPKTLMTAIESRKCSNPKPMKPRPIRASPIDILTEEPICRFHLASASEVIMDAKGKPAKIKPMTSPCTPLFSISIGRKGAIKI